MCDNNNGHLIAILLVYGGGGQMVSSPSPCADLTAPTNNVLVSCGCAALWSLGHCPAQDEMMKCGVMFVYMFGSSR